MNFDLLRRGEPDRVATGVVSPNFFDGPRAFKPIIGRTFVDADDKDGADAVLVLGHSYWQTRFGGNRDIVGQVFEMNNRPHTVIGVLPPVPHYPERGGRLHADVGMSVPRRRRAANQPESPGVLGAPGVRPAEAGRVARRPPPPRSRRSASDSGRTSRTSTGPIAPDSRRAPPRCSTELTSNARPMLIILLGTTGLILLIACANVANLTLARMLRRDRELAMRSALGAGRSRLIRQLLTESTLVAVAGGIVGLAFTWLTLDMLTTFIGRFHGADRRNRDRPVGAGVHVWRVDRDRPGVRYVPGAGVARQPCDCAQGERQGHERQRPPPPLAECARRRAGRRVGGAAGRRRAAALEPLQAAARRSGVPGRSGALRRDLRQLFQVSEPAVAASASTCRCSSGSRRHRVWCRRR